MTAALPDISLIIPAFNEASRLPRTLERIQAYLAQRSLAAEVLVVDDGSNDATAQIAEQWRARIPSLRVIANGQNRGKGYSVRQGMLAARGRMALFTDADLSAPIEEADKLLLALYENDFAIGSRAVDRSLILVHQSRRRELAGIIFNWFVRCFTAVPFADTQCGFKAFHLARCRIIFEQQRIQGFGFDPEVLFLARRHGLRGAEVAVRWAHDSATKVHVLRDSLRMFMDLLYIRANWLLGRYPLVGAAGTASSRTAPSG